MLCNIIFQQENALFLHILTKTTRFNPITTQFLVKLHQKHTLTQNAPELTLSGARSFIFYCDSSSRYGFTAIKTY